MFESFLNYIEFRTNHAPYLVHGMVYGKVQIKLLILKSPSSCTVKRAVFGNLSSRDEVLDIGSVLRTVHRRPFMGILANGHGRDTDV